MRWRNTGNALGRFAFHVVLDLAPLLGCNLGVVLGNVSGDKGPSFPSDFVERNWRSETTLHVCLDPAVWNVLHISRLLCKSCGCQRIDRKHARNATKRIYGGRVMSARRALLRDTTRSTKPSIGLDSHRFLIWILEQRVATIVSISLHH